MLETTRLRLLPWEEGEEALFEPLATDPLVMRFISGGVPWSEEQIGEVVGRWRSTYAARGFTRWRLELKSTGETIGFCGPGILQGFDEVEIGWWLAPAHWRHGYATEAGMAARDDAFGRCGLEKLISVTMQENGASQRVMQRLGFQFERDAMFRGSLHVVYSLTREEWERALPAR